MSAAPTSTLSSSSSSSTAFIRTTTNFISRQALIEGPQNVEMRGRVRFPLLSRTLPLRLHSFSWHVLHSLNAPFIPLHPPTHRAIFP